MAGDVIKMVIALDDKASPALKKVGTSTEAAGKASVKSSKGFKMSGAAMAKMGMAAIAAAAAFGKMIQALADSRNELIDTSTRTGLATDTIAGLRLAAEGSGMQFSALAAGLQQLPKRMSDTAKGTGEALDAFDALSVSVLDTSGAMRSSDEVLKETLSKLIAIESPTEKAALATELFGKAGTGMLQALSGTELQEFVDQAERFGVSVGPNAAKAAGDFQRELATFGLVSEKSMETFLAGFGSGPGGAGAALKGFGAVLIGITTTFKMVMDTGRRAFGVITGVVTDLFMAIVNLGKATKAVFEGDIAKGSRLAAGAMAILKTGITQAASEAGAVLLENISLAQVRGGISAGMEAFSAPSAGTTSGTERQAFIAAPTADEDKEKKAKPEKPEKVPTAEELAAIAEKQAEDWALMVAELQALSDSFDGVHLRIAGAVVNGMASPVEAMMGIMGKMGGTAGAAGGLLSALASMGAKGAKAIKAELSGFIKNIITALVEVLPEILVDLPTILIDAVPQLVGGLIKAIPKLIGAIAIQLPIAIFKGVGMWFVKAWKRIKKALSDLNPFKKKGGIFTPQKTGGRVRLAAATLGLSEVVRGVKGLVKGSKQTGGFINETGLQLLHQGERVIPSTGASTSAMQAAAGNIGGGGQTINISTNVVDPNALESLGRLLDRQFGDRGRSRAGIFSNAEPLGGLI